MHQTRAFPAAACFLTVLLLPGLSASAQPSFPSNAELRARLEQRLARSGGVGVVVGLLEPDGTRRVVAAGNDGTGAPLDEHTVLEIGSITKAFTAILLADMAARGELSLDDPVAKYLPAGQRVPERNGKRITLLDLATHHSGLPRMPTNFAPRDPKDPFADYTVEALYQFLADYELTRDPGESWLYSNIAVGLLGHALERRAGMPFEQLLRTRLLDPLGMRETAITLTESMRSRAAQGFGETAEPMPMWNLGVLPAAGGIRSTVHDMLTFAAANLAAGESGLAAAIRATHVPLRPMRDDQRIGLIWMVAKPRERTITWHWGGTGGFRSYLGIDLEARRAVVILANAIPMWNDFGHHLLDPEIPLAPVAADGLFAKLIRERGLSAALARMREIRTSEPNAWSFEEAHFNAIGYHLLRAGKVGDAIAVFTLGTELFPGNSNPWDSLGEAYVAAGRRDEAIASYRRSVELDPDNRNGAEALARLTAAASSDQR